jgi:hypothetical protein
MTAVAKAVHRGADGSVHFLSSTPDRSVLIITDPVLGKDEITFDGPVRLVPPRAGSGAVEYESISASGSTTVHVSPGQRDLIREVGGLCTYCCFPPLGQLGRSHDYELWPVCPGDARRRKDHAPGTPPEVATRDTASLRPAPSPSTNAVAR